MQPNQMARAIKQAVTPPPFSNSPWQWGQVHAVHTNPNTVDLYLDGSSNLTLGVRYMKGYTPTVGDVVLVGRLTGGTGAGQDRIVIGVPA